MKKSFTFYLWPLSNLIVILYALYIFMGAQEPLAIHFDAAGVPNNVVPPGMFLAIILMILFTSNLGLIVIYRFVDRLWPGYINIPFKEYWVSSESRQEDGKRMTKDMLSVVGIFVGVIHILCLLAIGDKLSPAIILPIALALSGVMLVGIFLMAKPPKQ